MSSFPQDELANETGSARPKPQSRTSARDEELLRSLHAALATDKPANRLVDKDTHFRIIKVEPKWRRPRKKSPKKASKTPRILRVVSPGASTAHLVLRPSHTETKGRETAGVRPPSTERSRAGQSSISSVPAAHASPKTTRSISRKKRKSSRALRHSRHSDETVRTSGASQRAGVVAGKESPAHQEESKHEHEGNAPEKAGHAVTQAGTLDRCTSESRLRLPSRTLDVSRLSRELALPIVRKDSRSNRSADPPLEDWIAPMPRKSSRRTKVALRSNLSVSRHDVENRNSGDSTCVDPVPQPRERTGSKARPNAVGLSQSHAAGLALESSRYSMQDLGAERTTAASRKNASISGGLSVTELVRPTEAVSQTSLQTVITPAKVGSLVLLAGVSAPAAAPDTSTSTQRAFQSDAEGTSRFQQPLGGGLSKPSRAMSGACFSPCLLSPKITEAYSSEKLLMAAAGTTGTLPNTRSTKDNLLTASLTSFSGYSPDDSSSPDLAWPSRPHVQDRVAGTKNRPRLVYGIEQEDAFRSEGDEKTLLALTVRRPSSNRRSVPSAADVSRGAVYVAQNSNDASLFYSASLADLPPTMSVHEGFFSVGSEDAYLEHGVHLWRRSSKKASQHPSSTAMPQDTLFRDDLLSNAAVLNKILSPSKLPVHPSNAICKDRCSRPSVAAQTIDRGRRATMPATRPVGVSADVSKALLQIGPRGVTRGKASRHSFSLNRSVGRINERKTAQKQGGSGVLDANAANRGDAATDSAYYTASEMRQLDQRRLLEGKRVRDSATLEATKTSQNTSFVLPEMGHAFKNATKTELPSGEQMTTSSSHEPSAARGASTKIDRNDGALLEGAVINPLCIYCSASEWLCKHDKRASSLTPFQVVCSCADKRAASTIQNKRLSGNEICAHRFGLTLGRQLCEELHPSNAKHKDSLLRMLPIRRVREPDSNLPQFGEEAALGHNLSVNDLAMAHRSRTFSGAVDSVWDRRSRLSFSPSIASPEYRDSNHHLLFPKASRAHITDAERAHFPGDPIFRSLLAAPLSPPYSNSPSDPSFRTARSSSEPNFAALRPRALRINRSLSDSVIVNPSSTTSDDVSVRDNSTKSPSVGVLKRTVELPEQRQLPKLTPKKKRPRQTVKVKPTAAETDMMARYSPDMARIPAAYSPGATGMEVSMTSRSHARELCLSMLAVSLAVLGLVLIARSAGGSLSRVAIPNLGTNAPTAVLSGRAANETVFVQTATPFQVAPLPLVCNLSRCVEEGANIASLLSLDSWVQARAASASVVGGVSASVFEDMERDLEQRVPRLLAAVRSPELSPLRRLYDRCNDVNAINAAGWAPLEELLRICGLPHWPYEQPATVSPWKAAARALQYTGAEAFMSLEVARHPLRINRAISALDRPLLALRSSDLAEQDVHWLEDTADTVMTAFRERPRHLARESVAMAVQIARLAYSRDALSDVRLYRVARLGPFPQLLEFLSTLFANISSVHASSEVLLRAEGFLRDLLDLADEHKNRALVNYIGLRIAVHSSAFLPDAVGLRAVHARLLFPHELTGGYVPRERLCARQVATTMPFLFLYAVRLLFGGEATVRALTSVLEALRRHLVRHLDKLALADYSTRVQLMNIAKETRFYVLGPPMVSSESHVLAHARALPSVGDDEPLLWFARVNAHVSQLRLMRLSRYVWRGGPFDRDCSSDLQSNELFVPPLFLNASVTLDRSLLALQTPHLGARFARCLLLMLLAGVSNRGNRELVTRGWWSDTSKSALGALRRCLARPAAPDDADDGGVPARAEKAPLSSVAEVLAVPPALDAFTEGVQVLAGPGRAFRLPRVEGLAPAQLFFDYYALSRCRRERHFDRSAGSAADEVNGPLRQSAAFHAAFECARGRPMNRVAPCKLWS
ncbi:hypothetical protein HPB50_009772 [Hyalomma asiaticum]|uniref:Uncharacterized protein n=1 Tax=Hyalomma asiaticum TaxID=266040 RepID=A0ACB7RZ32_HYAAI|nr:hypothetical protein HPB50_009772 [Hyalomma asiaticum]